MPYVNFLNGTTKLNDSVLNGMQRDLMQLVFPVRKYIHNTRQYEPSYNIRIWNVGKNKRKSACRTRRRRRSI